MKYLRHSMMVLGLLAATPAAAQTLNLFEPTQAAAQRDAPFAGPALPALGPVAAGGFTLRSTSRFGDEYHTVLADSAGNAIDLRWRSGERVVLPQQAGYAVINVSGSAVTLQQPANVPCQPDEARGVRCLDAQTALLTLATLNPVQRSMAPGSSGAMGPQPTPTVNADMPGSDADGNPVFVNPFSGVMMQQEDLTPEQVQARAERAQNRAQRLQQFQAERIPDDQIPPGMRLVRTPFGDRLVPVRQ
jgi:hypothetical protein